jgi:hypothetical protein
LGIEGTLAEEDKEYISKTGATHNLQAKAL